MAEAAPVRRRRRQTKLLVMIYLAGDQVPEWMYICTYLVYHTLFCVARDVQIRPWLSKIELAYT